MRLVSIEENRFQASFKQKWEAFQIIKQGRCLAPIYSLSHCGDSHDSMSGETNEQACSCGGSLGGGILGGGGLDGGFFGGAFSKTLWLLIGGVFFLLRQAQHFWRESRIKMRICLYWLWHCLIRRFIRYLWREIQMLGKQRHYFAIKMD